jgi:outer membrane protein
MKSLSLFLISFIILLSSAKAQKVLSLKECIDIALLNNQQVTDAGYQSELNKIALQQSQMQRLPNVNINLNQGLNTGRSIDPFSNQFIDQTIRFGNYGIGLDLTLFNGMQLSNTIKRNKATMLAGDKDAAAAKNIIILAVTRSYLQVISSNEISKTAEVQLASTKEQLALSEKRVAAGVLAETQLADLKAQVATEELNLANAKNSYELAKLDLFLAMNFTTQENNISFKPEEEKLAADTFNIDEVYTAAVKHFPDIQSAEQKRIAAERDRAIAKSLRYPVLSLFANAGSTYSSSVPKTQFVPDGTVTNKTVISPDNFITVGGTDYFIKENQSIKNGTVKPFTYFNQLNGNINSNIGLALRIPILNGMQSKFRIANANANIKRLDAQIISVKNQLRNAVEVAVQNLGNAGQRVMLTEKQVKALEQTLANASSRLNTGTANTLDYILAKTNYDRAKINLIQVKYEYMLRLKIVQFYQTGGW